MEPYIFYVHIKLLLSAYICTFIATVKFPAIFLSRIFCHLKQESLDLNSCKENSSVDTDLIINEERVMT